jgi:transposase
VITDGAGRAISFALAPGQAHELPLARELVDCLPDVPGWVVGDKGYASHAFRQFIWDQGARPAIPAKSNEAPVACPSWIYNNRNRVERLWARLKEWRAPATRKPPNPSWAFSASPPSSTGSNKTSRYNRA